MQTYVACMGRRLSSHIYNWVFNFTIQMQDIIGVEIFKQWNFRNRYLFCNLFISKEKQRQIQIQ